MRNRQRAVVAIVILVAAWTCAVRWIHTRTSRAPATPIGFPPPLDESISTSRPIVFPLLEAVGVDGSTGLQAASEHGIMCFSVTSERLAETAQVEMFSASPICSGVNLFTWPVSLAPLVVHVNTTDTSVSVDTGGPAPIWRLTCPKADLNVDVDGSGRACIRDATGAMRWAGRSNTGMAGIATVMTGNTATIDAGEMHLTTNRNGTVSMSHGGVVVELKRTLSSRIVLRIDRAGEVSIVDVDLVNETIVMWRSGVDATETIGLSHGSLGVAANGSRLGTRTVDIGSLVVRMKGQKTSQAPLYPLVTPFAPMYVDGTTISGTYTDARGLPVCTESVSYSRGSNGMASVSRTVEWSVPSTKPGKPPISTSSMSLTYAAPVKPHSTVWQW